MKILRIELLFFGFVSLALIIGLVQVNFGSFKFSNVVTTLSDTDWKGAPYVVKELNTRNRSYEDVDISLGKPRRNLNEIIDATPHYMVDLKMDGKRHLAPGSQVEVCLVKDWVSIDVVKEDWFHKAYNVSSLYKYAYHHINLNGATADDYIIEFEATLHAKGFVNKDYTETQINEFILYRTIELFDEYHRPEHILEVRNRITQIKMAVAYITGQPLKLA